MTISFFSVGCVFEVFFFLMILGEDVKGEIERLGARVGMRLVFGDLIVDEGFAGVGWGMWWSCFFGGRGVLKGDGGGIEEFGSGDFGMIGGMGRRWEEYIERNEMGMVEVFGRMELGF